MFRYNRLLMSRRSAIAAGSVPTRRRLNAVRNRLLRWYSANRRRLPWRERPEPYRVWVAEIMLQQTQVATVLPYYERFLARFPGVEALASAGEEEVTALWSGLGYYSRARNLHRAARILMESHGGRVPAERAQLEALPGIGRYTAGAILSIAFGIEEPIVDGNVRRFLSRLFLEPPAPGRSGRAAAMAPILPAQIEAWAHALVRGAPAADLNQALMEIGALICRPSAPLCPACPLASLCGARRLGAQERIPAPRRRRPTERVSRAVALIRDQGRILLERGRGPGAPAGMWDLPGALVPEGREARSFLERELARRRLSVRLGGALASVDHAILHRRIHTTAYEGRLGEPPPETASRLWVEEERAVDLPLGAAARRLLARISHRGSSRDRADGRHDGHPQRRGPRNVLNIR
jgi:A/G-specific adenine glycosylase